MLFAIQQSRALTLQVEQENQRRNLMQSDIKNTSLELNRTKNKEKQLTKVPIVDLKKLLFINIVFVILIYILITEKQIWFNILCTGMECSQDFVS